MFIVSFSAVLSPQQKLQLQSLLGGNAVFKM